MDVIRYNTGIPERNIAADEYFLMRAEKGDIGETLRIWESPVYFVVLGRACRLGRECFPEACERDGIKVIRRLSGGGTVLQGPGCLNFSLVLSREDPSCPDNITGSYGYILGRIVQAFREKGVKTSLVPLSDLAIGDRKVSGNAQARKRGYFLHHGTLLYDMDISRTSLYLKHPDREPGYRKKRSHTDFMANIPLPASALENMLHDTFSVTGEYVACRPDEESISRLVRDRYDRREWNECF